jgi:hypothetical protein
MMEGIMDNRLFMGIWLVCFICVITFPILEFIEALQVLALGVLFWALFLNLDRRSAWQSAAERTRQQINLELRLANYLKHFGPLPEDDKGAPTRRSLPVDGASRSGE